MILSMIAAIVFAIIFFGFIMPWIVWGFSWTKLYDWYDKYLDLVWDHTEGKRGKERRDHYDPS